MTEDKAQEALDRIEQIAFHYEELANKKSDATRLEVQEIITKAVHDQLAVYYEKLKMQEEAAAEAEKTRPRELSLKNVYKNTREIKNTWYSKDVIKDALKGAIDYLDGYTPEAPNLNETLSRFLNKVDQEIQRPTTFEKATERRSQKNAELELNANPWEARGEANPFANV
ncbi:hypothetical protein [Leadbettera azotonutricia]|uniref:hypothetical protein n=1 Tax=Leadbettera azotonutricia TaxID=150829 RepID=UPI0002EB2CF6|nr:hypothetical protein [Leadbettera azotonutricia]